LLISLGVNKKVIDKSNFAKNMVKKLDKGRVDAIAYGFDIAMYNMKISGIDTSQYEAVFTLKAGQMGYAFHKDTDQGTLDQLQKALDALKADGTVKKISAKYL